MTETTANAAPDERTELDCINELAECIDRARSIVDCVATALDHEEPPGSAQHYASGALRSARDILDEAEAAERRLDTLRSARFRLQTGAAGER